MKKLGAGSSEAIGFLNKVESFVMKKETGWYAADAIAVATMIWPDLVTSSSKALMSPVLEGPHRGSTTLELDANGNVEVVDELDQAAFKDKLVQYLS